MNVFSAIDCIKRGKVMVDVNTDIKYFKKDGEIQEELPDGTVRSADMNLLFADPDNSSFISYFPIFGWKQAFYYLKHGKRVRMTNNPQKIYYFDDDILKFRDENGTNPAYFFGRFFESNWELADSFSYEKMKNCLDYVD